MDMTRAFAKQIIKQGYAQHPQKLWSIQHKQACEMALADMEKLEQIEQIIKDDTYYEEYGNNAETFIVSAISEVLEDGECK